VTRINSETAHAWQKEALRVALIETAGNVTHAAKAIGLSLAHAKRLLVRYELRAFAADLRVEAGKNVLGRPAGSGPGRKRAR
jgi:hypothetical protein